MLWNEEYSDGEPFCADTSSTYRSDDGRCSSVGKDEELETLSKVGYFIESDRNSQHVNKESRGH